MLCFTRSILAVAVVSMLGFVSACADKKVEEVVAPAVEAPTAPATEVVPEAPPPAPVKAAKATKKAKKAPKK